MGAGGGEGSVAASNMLKPMLARGELRLIGATTLNEYREFIEKDAALERRFQQVYVGEPSVEDTVAISDGALVAVTPDARAWLAERGYDPLFGARPLRRLVQSEIQDRLALAILSGGVHDGDVVHVDVAADGSQLVLVSRGAPRTAPEGAADDDVIEAILED